MSVYKMKTEITPDSWVRFGNVINTSSGCAIYCMELSTFPETHMLTKFKCDSFSPFSKTMENLGWNYERVVGISKKSGTVSKVETENCIVFLDEEKRVSAPDSHLFIDSAPSSQDTAHDKHVWPVVRSEYSDVYQYLNGKRLNPCRVGGDCQCGKCLWNGISIVPESIPECSLCKNDTKKVYTKVNAGVKKVDIEPDCCKACIWWDWFHSIRKTMVECKCSDTCDCGKLRYRKKETVVAKMEKLDVGKKQK